jgi:hypothetical protein
VSVAEAPRLVGLTTGELERMAAYDIGPTIESEDDEALYGDEDAANAFFARSVLGCVRVAPVLMGAMLDGLGSPDPLVRVRAAMGAAELARTPGLHDHAGALGERLAVMAHAAASADERSALVLALGDLGVPPVAFLGDPSPAVRMCAALAPGLAADGAATAELVRALERVDEIDGWFVDRPPQFGMRPRFALIARLVERVTDFGQMVNGAIAVLAVTWTYGADYDWGPLLAVAFPEGSGTIRTEAQHRFLSALVGRAELWDRTNGNARIWFRKAGLPFDRDLCRRRIEESVPRPDQA